MKRKMAWLVALVLALGTFSGVALAEEEPVVLKYYRSGTTDAEIDESIETYQRLHQVALEQANVDLQLELFDWGDSYNQTLMMHAAAGDLPSGVWTLGGISDTYATELINNMGMAGMLYDWTDVDN